MCQGGLAVSNYPISMIGDRTAPRAKWLEFVMARVPKGASSACAFLRYITFPKSSAGRARLCVLSPVFLSRSQEGSAVAFDLPLHCDAFLRSALEGSRGRGGGKGVERRESRNGIIDPRPASPLFFS